MALLEAWQHLEGSGGGAGSLALLEKKNKKEKGKKKTARVLIALIPCREIETHHRLT